MGRGRSLRKLAPDGDEAPVCALCSRPVLPTSPASHHHLTPKLKGGARMATVLLHQVCHSAIHARFTEAELARRLATVEALRDDPALAKFIDWVRTKPIDFHVPTHMAKARARKWR